VQIIWDERKNETNKKKHGVSFEEAQELLRSDSESLVLFDDAHSSHEDRFISIGPILRGLVLVVWTERRDEETRIISARWATSKEVAMYRSYVTRGR